MPDHNWATQKLICRSLLAGKSEEVFAAYLVSDADRLAYRQMADEAVAHAVRRRSALRGYYRARIRNPLWLVVALAALIGAGCLAMAVTLWRGVDLTDPRTYSLVGGVAGFAAIGVAAIGWVASGWVTHRTGRSKLTMDVVAARFAQPAFSEALSAFTKTLRSRRIDGDLVAMLERSEEGDDRQAVQGLRYLLNYCEFISVGVLEGELDERIVAKTLRGTLTTVFDRSILYIAELQAKNPRTLEHFTTLRRHYRDL